MNSRLCKSKLFICLLFVASAGRAADWLQFQHDAANQGRAPAAVEPPFQLRWVWYGEDNVVPVGRPCPEGQVPRPPKDSVGLLSFTMHAVVAERRVVFGDLEGNLFCLDSRDGSTIWRRTFPGAFVHAPAIYRAADDAGDDVIVAPCQDGRIYGINWRGNTVWQIRARRPFVTPAKLDGHMAYAGSLDGTMYAIDVTSGKLVWSYDAGGPIRQPAAVAGERVFFGSEDMVFHAVDAATGQPIWKTKPGQMTGQSFRNTWPVVVGDKVMTFQVLVDGQSEFVMEALLFNATPGGHQEKRLADWPRERDTILDWLSGDMTWAVDCNKHWQDDPGRVREGSRRVELAGGPLRKTMYVFDIDGDGHGNAVEPYQVPMGIVGGTGNANMGPVLDARGRPITWWRVSARSIITGGSFGTAFSPDLSGLDLNTGDRIILPAERDIHRGGPGMELDNHHMLTAAGDYVYYHNPFRQARWIKLDGKQNPNGAISSIYRRFDGGGWPADVVYYPTPDDAGPRGQKMFFSHGAARTPVVIADDALFVNEIDIRALACYERRGERLRESRGADRTSTDNQASLSNVRPRNNKTPEVCPPDVQDYIWQKQTVDNITADADELKKILAEQVRIMIDAGHLLPYYCKRGETTPRWYFTNPGDTVAALCRAHPHLPAELQDELAEYLRQELAAYPPFGDRLNAPGDPGTSRMDFRVPPHKRLWNEGRLYRQLPRVHNVYSIWLYVDATGDVEYARRNWQQIRDFYEDHRSDVKRYLGGISAPIAMARLAVLVGDDAARDTAEEDAATAFASLHDEPAMRTPMLRRYGFHESWAREFVFQGFHLLQLTPEVARYIVDHPPIRASVLAHTDEATLHWPMWFVSQASTFTRYYGESHALSPHYSAMIFPVKARVERSDAARLRVWVDSEDAPRGDLFFIERLVLAIEATGEATWVDVRKE